MNDKIEECVQNGARYSLALSHKNVMQLEVNLRANFGKSVSSWLHHDVSGHPGDTSQNSSLGSLKREPQNSNNKKDFSKFIFSGCQKRVPASRIPVSFVSDMALAAILTFVTEFLQY